MKNFFYVSEMINVVFVNGIEEGGFGLNMFCLQFVMLYFILMYS